MLAAKFLQRGNDQGEAARMSLMMDIAELSAEELGPVMELVSKGEQSGGVMASLAVRWAMLDPKAALAFVSGRKGLGDNLWVVSPIVLELAKVDVPAAKAAVLKLEGWAGQETARKLILMMQEKDARAALAYARELGDEDSAVLILRSMAQNDPMAAAAELTPGKQNQTQVVEIIAHRLLEREPAAFESWADSLKDPVQRAAARSSALVVKAGTDPKGAALAATAWLAREPEAAAQDGFAPSRIVQCWLANEASPSEVAAWAAALPSGLFRDRAIMELGSLWEDTMAASAWVSSLPGGMGRDNAVRSLVHRIRDEDPADAIEWARTLGNPSMRYEALTSTLLGWAVKDLPAAQAAVETLPAGDRGYLLEVLQEQERERAKRQK
ncbi:MAG: hypothetical protein EOP86_20300 [Verrucomicrobiaceae bacterium]|nr:MAG: hypothetical protein EOP86_20300 [Verrucomicrobiaceae bacterium]